MKEARELRVSRWMRNMGLAIIVAAGLAGNSIANAGSFASQVVHYSPGLNPEAGYSSDASVALGAPERTTGENTPFGSFPGNVTMFNSPFGIDEIVSIGAGGVLTLELGAPATDDSDHLHGVDLIVYGNTFFNTDEFVVGNITGISPDLADIEVSSDNINWLPVTPKADGLFPTQGYLDAGIFGTDAFGSPNGTIETDFFKPMDPSLSINDFLGLTYAEALGLYNGSAGGTSIDISETGLSSVSYIRFSLPDGVDHNSEIDAVVVVPEPAAAMLVGVVSAAMLIRRRRAGS